MSLSLSFGSTNPHVAEHTALDIPLPTSISRGGWPTGNVPPLPIELSDAQLLTKVLGPATSLVCEKLTATYPDFRHLSGATPTELSEHGLKPAAIDRLFVVFEIAKRYGEHEFKPGEALRGSHDVYAHFREHLYAVLLDNKHRKIRDVV